MVTHSTQADPVLPQVNEVPPISTLAGCQSTDSAGEDTGGTDSPRKGPPQFGGTGFQPVVSVLRHIFFRSTGVSPVVSVLRHILCLAPLLIAGCGSPSKANIELRKQNQQLNERIAQLEQDDAAAHARIEGLEKRTAAPATQRTLDSIYTVHSIKLGRLCIANPAGIKVYVTPQDQDGDAAKAPGRVTIEAADLADPNNRVLDRWELGSAELKSRWRSLGPLQAFVLELPWKTAPGTSEIEVRVTFQDGLTDRVFRAVQKMAWEGK